MEGDDEILRKSWYEKAQAMTLEELPAFMEELSLAPHNYNTSAYAVAAAGVAASYAMNKLMGLTGFQAGFVMWEYMEHWNGVKAPARLVKYENMLYPQYKSEFDKTMDDETWIWLKQKAKKGIDRWIAGDSQISPVVINHWLRIVSGEKPFGYVTKSEYRRIGAPPALKTQADVLKAWKVGHLLYKYR